MDIDEAFRTWSISNASEEEWVEHLKGLCSQGIPNERVHPRAIIRALAINHLQTAKMIRELEATIERLDKQGEAVAKVGIWLTVAAVMLGVIQAAAAIVQIWFCTQG